MEKKKREIRFFIDREIYNQLKEEAKKLDIPLASYIKSNIINWKKKNGRRKESIKV